MEAAGIDRVITMDLHSPQVGGFTNLPFDHLSSEPILINYIKTKYHSLALRDRVIIMAPDVGALKRVEKYASQLKCDFGFISKKRIGDASRYYNEVKKRYAQNLHRGVTDWPYEIDDMAKRDIAASVQQVFEERVDEIMTLAKNLTGSDCLVYMGGCAMNSKYNQRLEEIWQFTWSLPWPGDASSAVGAWAAKKKIRVDYSKGIVKHLNIRV